MTRLVATLLMVLSIVVSPAFAGCCVHSGGLAPAVEAPHGPGESPGKAHAGVHQCGCCHHLGDRVASDTTVQPPVAPGPAIPAMPDRLAASRSPGPLLDPPPHARSLTLAESPPPCVLATGGDAPAPVVLVNV